VRWQEVALRLALVASFCIAGAYDISLWFEAPLAVLTIASTAELAIRPYGAHAVDRVLLACGAVVTSLIILGLLLNETPWGLTRTTWVVTWAILTVAVIAWRRNLGVRLGRNITAMGSLIAWMLTAVLIFALAGTLAMAGVQHWSSRPVLAFGLLAQHRRVLVVEIEATSTTATYRIVATSKVAGANKYSSSVVGVNAAGKGERLVRRVPVNTAGVWTINLESVDDGAVVRWLRVDVQ
jgi:hypothetical protein